MPKPFRLLSKALQELAVHSAAQLITFFCNSPVIAMASRRLAYNFNQALRSRAALRFIQPRYRGFATPINHQIKTESTTLNNGLTVCCQLTSLRSELTGFVDRNRAFTMGSDIDRRRLDRCWQPSRDGQNKRHCPFPRALSL